MEMTVVCNIVGGVTALSLANLGMIAKLKYDYTAAQDLYEQSIVIFRDLGEKRALSGLFNNLGNLANDKDDDSAAQDFYKESLAMFEDLEDTYGIAHASFNLGNLFIDQNNYPEAQPFFQESLRLSHKIGDKVGIASCLDNLALIMANSLAQQAVHIWAIAETLRETNDFLAPYTERFSTAIDEVRNTLGEEMFLANWQKGKTMPLGQIIEMALSTKAVLKVQTVN